MRVVAKGVLRKCWKVRWCFFFSLWMLYVLMYFHKQQLQDVTICTIKHLYYEYHCEKRGPAFEFSWEEVVSQSQSIFFFGSWPDKARVLACLLCLSPASIPRLSCWTVTQGHWSHLCSRAPASYSQAFYNSLNYPSLIQLQLKAAALAFQFPSLSFIVCISFIVWIW